jgi:hypothetical protein
MPKNRKIKVEAKAVAKIEASAKASFQRKKNITEVIPPDVIRAKAGAWLDLISPVTQWAGLKGDALKYQRSLLRIQQEEVLLRIAQSVRNKLANQTNIKPIPPKILVPALEKASIEDVADDVMIERWANLLASAAQEVGIQPRFVGILDELAGTQAECLERLAFNRYLDSIFPDADFEDSFIEFAEYNIRRSFERAINASLSADANPNSAIEMTVRGFSRPGVSLALTVINDLGGDMWEYDSVAETGIREEADMSILESLGLVRYVVIEFNVPLEKRRIKKMFEVSAYYHHLTQLDVDFCKVCSRPRVEELEKIGNESRRKKLRREERF